MSHRSILIVAEDPAERASLCAALSNLTQPVATASSLAQALLADPASVGLVVLDHSALTTANPARAFELLRERPLTVPCLVALRDATVDEAVDLMRHGAYSVISLPVDAVRLAFQVDQALRHRDLAEKSAALEKRLDAHERLAMIGKLAAGVAHELNNPLDGVLRFVNLTVEGLPKDSPQVPYLLEARRGLRRMADIVRDLLQFSRNAGVDASNEDGERLARDAVAQALAGAADRSIDALFSFPAAPVPLPRAMFQVFANLARNAVDAMPHGGTITVRARIASGRVVVEIADTGTGIPEDIRDRIFEPFFTTKDVGKGTGLGLSISARIVERVGGTLTIESETGRGTKAVVDVPARTLPAPNRPAAESVALAASGSPFA